MKPLQSYIPNLRNVIIRMFASIAFAMLLLFVAALPLRPVVAQEGGIPRNKLVRLLDSRFDEAQVGLGLADNGGVIELFTSGRRSTWTIVLTMPNGLSYLVFVGEGWTRVREPAMTVYTVKIKNLEPDATEQARYSVRPSMNALVGSKDCSGRKFNISLNCATWR